MKSDKDSTWAISFILALASITNLLIVGMVFSNHAHNAYAEETNDNGRHEDTGDGTGNSNSGIVDGGGENGDDHTGNYNLLGGNIASFVLIGTIGIIAGAGGYTGYKVLKIRKKSSQIKSGLNKGDNPTTFVSNQK
jgi:hypothetical protein